MDDRRVADYFVVAGLPENPFPLEEFSNEAAIKPTYKLDPITDITVINKSISEKVPRGYTLLEKTPSDYPADMNHGSLRQHEMYICYRRSRDKPPLTDVGVLYEGKERLMSGCEVIHTTYFGTPANVNNSSNGRTYITYRRAAENAPSDMLAVVDLCIVLENKGEGPPHSYCQIHKNLNRGLMGSDVYLCYKKAMTKTDILAYKPAILNRYPAEDYADFPLPESVSMFCLPMGATVECWSAKAQHPYPVFSTFILTGIGWNKVYGAAITFYEEYSEDKLTDLQMRHLGLKNKHIREQYRIMKTVHSNKSICLLSRWPFFEAFKHMLQYIHRISITGPHSVPIERHISHFMYDVPYPSPQRPRILVQLSHDAISLAMPEDSPLPQSGASFVAMLKNLGPENCMTILLYVLHEHKILVHSLRASVLTAVAEAISTLIFPLQWQCPYIPLCPLGLSDVLSAPTPYIIGLDSRYFDLFDPPPDVFCVDLDTIRIWPPDDKKNLSYKLLPRKPTKVLQESLHRLYDRLVVELPRHGQDDSTVDLAPLDQDFKKKHKEILLELEIQEVFLRFMACILKGYKNFLKPIANMPDLDTTNAASLFDMQGFLKSREKANHKFYQTLLRTQLFNRFIEERSFVSDKDDSLAFFDECTEKVVETSEEPKLIELEDSSKSERTMFILPPEPVGLPDGKQYSYNGFPQLQGDLFLEKNKPARSSSQQRDRGGPSSPVARRTKQEIRTAQKHAQQVFNQPSLWAKCLLSHAYSLWFMLLPAYIKYSQSVTKALILAYDVLKNMQRQKLKPPDELCYRVMLQLCGQYNKPVLAVKVYSEMKHAGVHPNAITYGYYNKAVLEGRWPTTISQGRVLWRKLRNVVLGVAKFKRAVRRRSMSICSNSGSEYDQVSHASLDSCLEEERLDTRHETIMLAGSRSDHGQVPGSLQVKVNGKIPEEVENDEDKAFKGSSDLSTADQFRMRVKSIVRQISLPAQGSPRGSFHGSSAAGVLMVSESLMSGDALSKSMGPTVGHVGLTIANDKQRKRHRSAGDFQTKARSNSLFANWRQKHSSEDTSIKFSDILASEEGGDGMKTRNLRGGEVLSPGGTEMQDISEEIKDSGVGLDENEALGDVVGGNEGGAQTQGTSSVSKPVNCDSEPHNIGDHASLIDGKGLTDEQTLDNIAEIKSRSSSLKSATSSPLHSVATPVTENDPLGLFTAPDLRATKIQEQRQSPEKNKEEFVAKKPFEGEVKLTNKSLPKLDLGLCNSIPASSSEGKTTVDSTGSAGERLLEKVLSPVEKVQKTLLKLERTNSFPENLGNSSKTTTPSKSHSVRAEVASLGRSSSSLYEQKTEPMAGTPRSGGLFRTGSFRRHKQNFSGMLKIATGAVANKLSEMKWLTPTKMGSNNSLTPSYDDSDSETESYQETQRKKGSLDFLHRSIDRLDAHSINGTHESAPSHPSFLEQMERECELERASDVVMATGGEAGEMVIDVEMSSCSRCPRCRCLLYDEELMAGWNADDSNLNTACHFCHSKLVPHLLIYIKDYRRCKVSETAEDDTEALIDFGSPGAHHPSPSYGKDVNICPPTDPSGHFMFGEDMEDNTSVSSFDTHHDPWQRHSDHVPASPPDVSSPSHPKPAENGPSLSEMANMGHRRTTSECLTSATMYSSSLESLESLTFKNLRSPLSISMDESDDGHGRPTLTPERRRAMFEGGLSSMEPVSVPYLSPLVLRKNLESIIESEGNSALAKDSFLDDHPIIYWNLMWYFKRIGAYNHLTAFLLTSQLLHRGREPLPVGEYGPENVRVRACWDNLRIHQEVGLPMHVAWNNLHSSTTVDALLTEAQPFNRAVMHQIISNIQCNDVLTPIKLVMNGRRRLRPRKKRFRSMYRDITYLAFKACGRDNIDNEAFDREYKMAFSRLSPGEMKRLQRDDKPRSPLVQACRKVFSELDL
ncbi:C-myc promoter-binding protein-like isoform X2 [Mya arenaria]|uniref:C-myc promoter-binding protein-like isoform X2 n=1 Tax=Mya arenaria TaxID=6604 RepID=UPI0022E3EA8B|nr:C-myc promoter-binding protein-like isoform X2 [Mya arenaria]